MGETIFTAVTETTPESSRLTFASIVDAVLKNLEKDSIWFPNEDIEYYVLQCFDIMSEQTGVIETTDIQVSTIGTWLYDVPAGCIGIIAVSYDYFDLVKQDKKKILKMFNSSQNPTTVTGMPTAWYFESVTQIGLFPTPSDAKNIRITYFTYQDDLTDVQTPVFLRSVNAIAEAYATYMLMARDKENTAYGMYKTLYEDLSRKFIINSRSTPQFQESSEYFDDLSPDDKRMI